MVVGMDVVAAEVLARLLERHKNPPRRFAYADKIEPAESLGERFNAIRGYYKEALPIIMAAPPNRWPISCHEVEWPRLMTPIERALWSDIRTFGVVLFPQFPVGRYFVDFGHPVAKVAIECDGAAYHRDKEREARRTADIERLGWTIYRLEGWQCIEPDPDPWDEDQTPATNVQLIRHLCAHHDISYGPYGRSVY
jgi:hypothetical protein